MQNLQKQFTVEL